MATKKKYTRPRAVDLGLSPKKTPTRAQETGGKVKPSKIIAPTGRGKAISGGKAAMNVAKGVGSSAAHALRAIPKPSWMSEKSMGPAIAAFMGFRPKAGNRVGPGTKIRRA